VAANFGRTSMVLFEADRFLSKAAGFFELPKFCSAVDRPSSGDTVDTTTPAGVVAGLAGVSGFGIGYFGGRGANPDKVTVSSTVMASGDLCPCEETADDRKSGCADFSGPEENSGEVIILLKPAATDAI